MARLGGLNKTALFALKVDHSGIVTFDADMKPTTTAATAQAAGFMADKNFSTAISVTNGGSGRQYTLDTDKWGSKILNIIDNFRISEAAAAGATEVYQDGKPADPIAEATTGTDSTANYLLALTYIGEDSDGASNIIVEAAVVQFTADSGGYTLDRNRTKTSAVLVSSKALAAISIPIALFDSNIVTPAAIQVLAKDKHFVRLLVPKKV